MGKSFNCKPSHSVQCVVVNSPSHEATTVRRTANYQPPIWDYDYVQSLRSDYVVTNLSLFFAILLICSRFLR